MSLRCHVKLPSLNSPLVAEEIASSSFGIVILKDLSYLGFLCGRIYSGTILALVYTGQVGSGTIQECMEPPPNRSGGPIAGVSLLSLLLSSSLSLSSLLLLYSVSPCLCTSSVAILSPPSTLT